MSDFVTGGQLNQAGRDAGLADEDIAGGNVKPDALARIALDGPGDAPGHDAAPKPKRKRAAKPKAKK